MSNLNFVARAALRESGAATASQTGSNPYHRIALREAERVYRETIALLEAAEQEEKRPSRAASALKTGAKVAAGAGGAYLAGMGGLGAYRAYKNGGRSMKAMGASALAHIKNPRAVVNSIKGSTQSAKDALIAKYRASKQPLNKSKSKLPETDINGRFTASKGRGD